MYWIPIEMNEKVSIGSILVGIYLFSVPAFSYSENLGLNIVPQIIGVLVVIYAVYSIIVSGSIIKNTPLLVYFLFAVWCIITYTFSDYTDDPETVQTLLKVAVITVSAGVLIRTKKDFNVSVSLLFLSIFLTFLLNFEDVIGFRSSEEIAEMGRFSGTLENANTAALYSMTIIWVGFTIAITMRISKMVFIFLMLGIIIAFFIVIFSGSRKGIIGLVIFAILLGWVFNKKYGQTLFRSIFILLMALVGIFFIFQYILDSPFFSRYESMISGGDSSLDKRIYLFKHAFYVWSSSLKNALMGVGIGNFHHYNYLRLYSHSTITETLVCSGLVGFGLYFLGFGSVFVQSFRAYKVVTQQEKIQTLLIFVFLLMLFIFKIAAVMFYNRLFWPLTGVISAHVINLRLNNLK